MEKTDWLYEDELPIMTDSEYSEWFNKSKVIDGVRMGPNPCTLKNN